MGYLGWALAASLAPGDPGPPVHYDLSFDNAVHHEARISVTYRSAGEGPLTLTMARSSPGRYAIHEFAKNVYSVSAVDGAGRALQVSRADPYQWTVAGHDGTVTVSYTLYADRADGTYSQIDSTHAHLNSPATFLWARGFEERPITVRFRPFDEDWKVATQLPPAGEPGTFRAPNLQYLMDSPIELSDHELREWQVEDGDGRYTIRLAVHHSGSAEDVDRFAERVRRVVAQQIELFGDVPNFDFGTYTFLADYLPHVESDGMEHRNSTILTDPRSLQAAAFSQLGTVSHEFFHAWNVERIRPAELEPFDFTRANPTPSLWLGEGFTSYYGPLLIRRAGLSSVDDYLRSLSAGLDYVVNAPGRRYGSPQEMSLRAAFTDAATSIDPDNHPNIFVSYYPYGAIVGLALDLTLRQRPDRLSLDDYMRHLWTIHGQSERPYMAADLRRLLAELTGDPGFADAFFERSIEASHLPDFEPLLAQAGLRLRLRNEGAAWAGPAELMVQEGAVALAANTAPGTPLYEAGLDRGDRIVSLGATPIESVQDWGRALRLHSPGDETEIRFVQRGQERRANLRFVQDPALEVVRNEAIGLVLTPEQRSFRQAWLGPEAG